MTVKTPILLTNLLLLITFSIWADIDIDTQNIGEENINQPAKRTPFSFDTHIDAIGGGEITNGFYKKDKVDYGEAQVEAGMIVYYNPSYTEGGRIAVGFSPTYLNWHGNPWFEQDHFNILSVTLTGFTKRADRWFWRTQLTANFDTDEWSSKYTSYDLILWGRYTFCQNIGFHIGFLAETGMKLDRIYPIIGFDWTISEKWKLNLVFPMNMTLIYSLNPKWSIGAAGRLFNSRFRVNHDQHSHRPLVRYTNLGAELFVQYETKFMTANLHAGSTLWGKFRVADHNNNHARDYDLGPAGYVGAEMEVKF
ncbi:MAG: DUF6268 family outer membrane beta-barrel protein [Parachlamydiaceae bacterium]